MSSLQKVADVSVSEHWTRDMEARHMKRARIHRDVDLVLLWREGLSPDQYQRASTAADFAKLPHVRLDKRPTKQRELLEKAGLHLAGPLWGNGAAPVGAPSTPLPPPATMWAGPLPPGSEATEPLSLHEIGDEDLFTLAQLLQAALAGNVSFRKMIVHVDDDGESVVRLFRRKDAPVPQATPQLAVVPGAAPIAVLAEPETKRRPYTWKSEESKARVQAAIAARWDRYRIAKGLPPKETIEPAASHLAESAKSASPPPPTREVLSDVQPAPAAAGHGDASAANAHGDLRGSTQADGGAVRGVSPALPGVGAADTSGASELRGRRYDWGDPAARKAAVDQRAAQRDGATVTEPSPAAALPPPAEFAELIAAPASVCKYVCNDTSVCGYPLRATSKTGICSHHQRGYTSRNPKMPAPVSPAEVPPAAPVVVIKGVDAAKTCTRIQSNGVVCGRRLRRDNTKLLCRDHQNSSQPLEEILPPTKLDLGLEERVMTKLRASAFGNDAPAVVPPAEEPAPPPATKRAAPVKEAASVWLCAILCHDDNALCGAKLRSDNTKGICGYHQVAGHRNRRPGATAPEEVLAVKLCGRPCHDEAICGWPLPERNTSGICGYHLSGAKKRRVDLPLPLSVE